MSSINKKIPGHIRINKYIIIFLFIFFLANAGASYAYFAYQVEDTVAIKGNIVAIDAELNVELVVGTNDDMVPLQDAALSNAINGVGSSNGACVDSLGSLSCQIYKITLTNNGSRLKNLKGTIELYAKSGSGNVYNNLKWRELTDLTTIKEGSVINNMEKSVLVTGLTVQSKEVKTWYVAVWISEVDSDQTNTDKGDFGGTVTFEVVDTTSTEFIEETLEENAILDTDANIDFASISSDTNGKGIYLRSGTENDPNPIYYYRGEVDNNLLFAGFCWKIVRTTETGGLKLIYNGTPTDGQCNNTGEATQISTKAFNTNYNSPAYVGYMYGTPYTYTSKSMSSITDTYYYGNDVSYDEETGQYTLIDTTSSADWSSIYNTGLNNYHYTCFSTGTTCDNENGEVYYIYYTSSSTAYYITLTEGKKVEDALKEMLDNNNTSSTIKGNKDTSGTLDYWYYTNIEKAGYDNYIEDTIWCNDRSIGTLNGWDPDGGSNRSYLYFSAYNRIISGSPNLTCADPEDRFTKNTDNGNGDLDYPVGLLTADEIMLAGGAPAENSSYYLYTGMNYWAGSPIGFYDSFAGESFVWHDGSLDFGYVDFEGGVRPSVSLKPGFTIADGGTGTTSNPYVVS